MLVLSQGFVFKFKFTFRPICRKGSAVRGNSTAVLCKPPDTVRRFRPFPFGFFIQLMDGLICDGLICIVTVR